MDTQTKENIVNDYKNGLKLVEIFFFFFTSYYTVSKLLDAQGIDHSRKKEKGKPNLKNMRILSQEEEDLVCKTTERLGEQIYAAKLFQVAKMLFEDVCKNMDYIEQQAKLFDSLLKIKENI